MTAKPAGVLALIPLAFLGQLVGAALSMFLARRLGLGEFEAYVVAASVFILMLAIAPFGSEKLALRILPDLLASGDLPAARAYLAFATRRCLLGATAAIALCLFWIASSDLPPATTAALAVACAALPAGALACLGRDVLTAAGNARFAATVVRVVVPVIAAALVGVLALTGSLTHGALAIAAWAVGWIVGVGLMLRRAPSLRPSTERPPAPAWRSGSRPLWLYRLAAGLMAQAGIIGLELAGAPAVEIGAYAAAASLVAVAIALVGSTNRVYAREIGLALATGAPAGIEHLLRRRAAWLLPALALLLAVAFTLSDPLLALYRPDFVEPGRAPLRLLSLAAAVSMAFALAPTTLIYRGAHASVLVAICAATAAQVLLLAWLAPRLGATGAALSYAAGVLLLYGWTAILARRPPASDRSG